MSDDFEKLGDSLSPEIADRIRKEAKGKDKGQLLERQLQSTSDSLENVENVLILVVNRVDKQTKDQARRFWQMGLCLFGLLVVQICVAWLQIWSNKADRQLQKAQKEVIANMSRAVSDTQKKVEDTQKIAEDTKKAAESQPTVELVPDEEEPGKAVVVIRPKPLMDTAAVEHPSPKMVPAPKGGTKAASPRNPPQSASPPELQIPVDLPEGSKSVRK
jgi:hypothetical protein